MRKVPRIIQWCCSRVSSPKPGYLQRATMGLDMDMPEDYFFNYQLFSRICDASTKGSEEMPGRYLCLIESWEWSSFAIYDTVNLLSSGHLVSLLFWECFAATARRRIFNRYESAIVNDICSRNWNNQRVYLGLGISLSVLHAVSTAESLSDKVHLRKCTGFLIAAARLSRWSPTQPCDG